ncbi:DUF4267 domain-containing protein [Natrinema pellirubrum]|uniref:DUF4267 domain-containing protein n=1 Tax=Natrinema pellirubrum TaxID=69525 RepID=UPI00022DBABC|nr:DUF4267 domain-containing protein [Natrinema pellirubrum]
MTNEETILKEINANYTQSEDRAIGGILTITPEAVKSSPNKVDELTGENELYIPVKYIESIGIEEKFSNGVKSSLTNGGLRDRLRIKRKDGQPEFFVISNLTEVVDDLQLVINGDTLNLDENNKNPELGSLLLKGIAYLFGGIALLLGVLYLASSNIAVGILLLFAAIIGMPYTRRIVGDALGVRINKWTATVLFILFWITASQLLA